MENEGHDCIDINNDPTGKPCAACAAETAEHCPDCGHTPETGACYRCKAD